MRCEYYEKIENKKELIEDLVKQIEYFTLFPPPEMTHLILYKNQAKKLCISPCFTLFPTDCEIIWTFTGEPFRDGWEYMDWERDDIEEITGLAKEEILAEAIRTSGAILTENEYRGYVKENFREEFENYIMCEFDKEYGEDIRKRAEKLIEYELERWKECVNE